LLLHASAHHFQHHVPVSRFLLMSRTRLPRRTTRFPYTTLFRSRQMQDFKNETRGALLRQKAPLPQPAEFYNKRGAARCAKSNGRSEEHTSELQSRFDLVCRLLLEKKKQEHHRSSSARTGAGSQQ